VTASFAGLAAAAEGESISGGSRSRLHNSRRGWAPV
jgi:hypothetical protein